MNGRDTMALTAPYPSNDEHDATGDRSVLSRHSKITGDLEFPGRVEILGRIDGKVIADTVVIGEPGEIDGGISAKSIAIKGRVNGEISGDSVTLHTGAKVNGTVSYQHLVIETGAEVEAQIAMRRK
ncbi:bactofilin family protein [Pontibaca salina]|uniref:Polymer-forming cytoskeletal protein n=1 Tax=Pontibaca salina TaxID=2795731 RepID=A0A934LZB0_9RHOB|nr:polymer-forming cytoskeletal protein [Pontibaca salina]MBI6628483.1 polymer-forming cytoskeletal protein [Pontibaca salina]